MSQELQPVPQGSTSIVSQDELSIDQLVGMVAKVQEAMKRVMKDGEDYGVIPGTKGKPTLLKPGAEKLAMMFRLAPEFSVEEEREGDHRTYRTTCRMVHIGTGRLFSLAVGSCSTRESKYAWRKGDRTCPKCGAAAIRKSKEDNGGFYCWTKIDGCGAKFHANDPAIASQPLGRVENPDLPDCWNTVLKMSNKRALVAATLLATGASCIFSHDIEDFPSQYEPEAATDMMPRAKSAPAADDIPFTPATPITTPVASKSNAPPATADRVKVVIKNVDVGSGNTNGKPWTRYRFTLAEVDPAGTPFEATTFSSTIGEELRGAVGMEGVAILTKEAQGVKLWGMDPC